MNRCLTLAAVLFLAMVSGLSAATDAEVATAPSPTVAAMSHQRAQDQLELVRDHGKSLAREISDVEDDLYKRFNKLNKNKDFEVFCRSNSLVPDGVFRTQSCEPRYVAKNRSTLTESSHLPFPSSTVDCGVFTPVSGDNSYIDKGCYGGSHSANIPPPSRSPSASVGARAPVKGSFTTHFKKVVISDPGLFKQYMRLAGLSQEMERTQSRYAEARNAAQGSERQ